MKKIHYIMSKGIVFSLVVGKVFINIVKSNWITVAGFVLVDFVIYWIIGGLLPFGLLAVFIVASLYNMEDYLLYHPELPPHSRVIVSVPSVFGLPYESVHTHTTDGVRLHLLVILQSKGSREAPTVLYLHGNAGNVGHRLQNAAELYQHLKCNVVMLEYRGYGHSSGSPSEEGLYTDARAALDYIASRPDLNHNEIILFGRSLGGAIGIDTCTRISHKDKIWCLIVENTFTSIPEMANVLIGGRLIRKLPLFCYKNKFTSNTKVSKVQVPVLFISGLADTLVPPRMMEELHRLCTSSCKKLVRLQDGTHNETWNCQGYYGAIDAFLNEARQRNLAVAELVNVT